MRIILITTLLMVFTNINGQDKIDSLNSHEKSIINYGFVPIISYDTDLGIRYGVVANRFVYEDTTKNRRCYSENDFIRVFNTTKGSFQVQALLESDRLIKRSKVLIEISYLYDKSFDFYGFNGDKSILDQNFIEASSTFFINTRFYQMQRKLLRARFDWQHKFTENNSRLLFGLTVHHYDLNQPNKNDNTLYNKYIKHNLIQKNEQKGGLVNLFSVGYVYEKRNNQCYCSDGTWFETYLVFSSEYLSRYSFSKLITTYRTYKELSDDKFVLMMRASAQTKINGTIPFYMLTNYFDTRLNQDGLGGAFNLRGINRSRIVSNGFALLNTELRYNIYIRKKNKKQIHVDGSVFFDNVLITQKYKFNYLSLHTDYRGVIVREEMSYIYSTAGIGLYFIMNRNNVININWGTSVFGTEQTQGLYVGSSFLF